MADDKVIAPVRRSLFDLFVLGEEVSFDDGSGEPVVIWVQKLTQGETQECVEMARPAKQKIVSIKRLDDDNPLKLRYLDELESNGYETEQDFIEYVLRDKINESLISARERIAAEEEWSKDEYLVGLQKAWNDELYLRWLQNPEDEEAIRVFEELKRYTDQVTEEAKADKNELIYEIQDLSLDALKRKAMNSLIEEHSDNALINEFRKFQLYYAVRNNDDRSQKYFDSADQIKFLPDTVLNKIQNVFNDLSVDGFEGKE
jgi:hypothetical protein